MSEEVALVERAAARRPAASERGGLVLPRVIADAGSAAMGKSLEFFAARIANRRTRAAYRRGAGQFLAWCEARVSFGLSIARFCSSESAMTVASSVLPPT